MMSTPIVMKLKNKFAIVTGASTGIGRAISLALAKDGAYIALVARRQDRLAETKQLIENGGGKADVFVSDLSDVNSINNLIEEIKKQTKQIDILVNVAGIWHGKDEAYAGKDFETFEQKIILDTYNVGIVAPTLFAHAFAPLMPKKSKIVNISGTFESGAKGWLPYFVSKKAIEDLTIGLSQELEDKDIQVNCISPSDTATEAYKKYFPQYIKDAVEPEVIAQNVLDLCLTDNITGTIKVVKQS